MRPVEAAAVRPEPVDEEADPPTPAPASASAPAAPPHDESGAGASADDEIDDDGDHDGETVLSGDLRGRATRTRPAPDEIAPAAAAHRYALVLPDGHREALVGELILGRAPTARVVDGRMPRLVTIEGDPDVSRSHVRVALEGDTVVVTDLRSRNGTSVVLPGKQPQLLRADEPTPVIPGTVIDLGESKLRVERADTGAGDAA
ncbi:FHA domain-containing protein [Pseudolysinimonas kribbensis]|uniref:FHA domain-containing protein n=1 Tax=Pseudolysinimonas kribbensis TaxID=433641 RepID=UPI0024E0B683|nr:FHA domain-containing protein [Pseudolysinimonas kribbensis]